MEETRFLTFGHSEGNLDSEGLQRVRGLTHDAACGMQQFGHKYVQRVFSGCKPHMSKYNVTVRDFYVMNGWLIDASCLITVPCLQVPRTFEDLRRRILLAGA